MHKINIGLAWQIKIWKIHSSDWFETYDAPAVLPIDAVRSSQMQ